MIAAGAYPAGGLWGELRDFVHKTVHGRPMKAHATSVTNQQGWAASIRPDLMGRTPTNQGARLRSELLGVKGPTKRALDFNRLRAKRSPEGAERMYLLSQSIKSDRNLIAASLALVVALLGTATPVRALEPISEEKHINYSLISAAIGALIKDNCSTIGVRGLTALSKALALKRYALNKGYTKEEIDAYTKSKSAKTYVRAQADAYLAAHGVVVGEEETYCALGREEIANKTLAGSLIRVRK